jgi:hypothetical protein
MPIAAPAPSSHQAAIPAYARVVGSNPPFAYERAKTAAAIPIPAAVSRRSTLCSRFTLARGTGSYSSGVLGGLRRLLLAVIVAGAVLWAPAAAFPCSGSTSAVNVYKECVPTGSGSKPTTGGANESATSGSTVHVSKQTAKALRHAGKDRRRLAHLLRTYGTNRLPNPSGSGAATTAPSALGSAFNLGSGPTALLIVLAGTAVLLLGGSGVRVWRHRHRA